MTRIALAFVLGTAVGAGGVLWWPSEPPAREVVEVAFSVEPLWWRCPPPVTIEAPLAREL